MKRFIMLISMLLIIKIVISQSCFPNGIVFQSQSSVDSYALTYPNCTEIEGYLAITGDDITNLDSLYIITKVNYNLFINNTSKLLDISGLSNLNSVGSIFIIQDNEMLTNLDGLDNVTSVGDHMVINSNPSLISISSLNSLISVEGGLSITNNVMLTDLSGLTNITSIGGDVKIVNNKVLQSIHELNNLETLLGNIVIGDNALVSLNGLTNIIGSSVRNIYIAYNPSLSECDVLGICDYLTDPAGDAIVSFNSVNCNSRLEVEEACGIIGINNNSNKSIISISPNPATDKIFISYDDNKTVELINIYSQTGSKVYSTDNINTGISVATFNPGLYIIEIITNGLKIREKLIIL
ncbi:MAG: T9SS type A sorting domain-containing protein [Bacteroidota bacterium]